MTTSHNSGMIIPVTDNLPIEFDDVTKAFGVLTKASKAHFGAKAMVQKFEELYEEASAIEKEDKRVAAKLAVLKEFGNVRRDYLNDMFRLLDHVKKIDPSTKNQLTDYKRDIQVLEDDELALVQKYEAKTEVVP